MSSETESEMIIDGSFYDVPIESLTSNTCMILRMALDETFILTTDEGIYPDWRGLAFLIGMPANEIYMNSQNFPTYRVLSWWFKRDVEKATVRQLLIYLQRMERYAVIQDAKSSVYQDILTYQQNDKKSLVPTFFMDADIDTSILTRDDLKRQQDGLGPQMYDAFVLFSDDDVEFAIQLIERMERESLRLCVKDRDLLVNMFQDTRVIKLISDRCNKLIVIISNSFMKSASNKFFYSFTQSMDIERRQPKVILCVYTPCQMLYEMSCYTLFDYRNGKKLWNFWERLRDQIRPPKTLPNKSVRKQVPERKTSIKFHNALNISTVPEENELEENSITSIQPVDSIAVDDRPTVFFGAATNESSEAVAVHVGLNEEAVIKTDSKKPKWLKKLLVHKKKCSVETEGEHHHKKETGFLSHFKRKVALAN